MAGGIRCAAPNGFINDLADAGNDGPPIMLPGILGIFPGAGTDAGAGTEAGEGTEGTEGIDMDDDLGKREGAGTPLPDRFIVCGIPAMELPSMAGAGILGATAGPVGIGVEGSRGATLA